MNKNYSDWKKQVAALSDDVLLEKLENLGSEERDKLAWQIAHLAETFRRELALKRGKGSIYAYAREKLKLSDGEAWKRGNAARLALEVPETIERIASGELLLTVASDAWSALRNEQEAARTKKKPQPPAVTPAQTGFDLTTPQAPPRAPTPPPPVSSSEKKEVLQKMLGKSCNEAKNILEGWKEDRSPDPAPAPVRPHCVRKKVRQWTELTFHLNDAELAELDRLRDLLSHKLGTKDAQAVFGWMLHNALEKEDPVRKQDRADLRKAKKHEKATMQAAQVQAPTESCAPATSAPAISTPATSTPATSAPATSAPAISATPTFAPAISATPTFAPAISASAISAPAISATPQPRPPSEKETPQRKPIPAELRRKVWIRDGGKCQYTDSKTGTRCGSTAFCDLDHRLPVSNGGQNTEDNLALACSNHNRRRHHWRPEDQPTYAIPPSQKM